MPDLLPHQRYTLWSRSGSKPWTKELTHTRRDCERNETRMNRERPDIETLILPPGEVPQQVSPGFGKGVI